MKVHHFLAEAVSSGNWGAGRALAKNPDKLSEPQLLGSRQGPTAEVGMRGCCSDF